MKGKVFVTDGWEGYHRLIREKQHTPAPRGLQHATGGTGVWQRLNAC